MEYLTILIPLAVIIAFFVGMAYIIKRSWIDKRPMSPGSQMIGRQNIVDLENHEGRQALAEVMAMSERPDSDEVGEGKDPEKK